MAIWFEICKQKIKMGYKEERNKMRFNKISCLKYSLIETGMLNTRRLVKFQIQIKL